MTLKDSVRLVSADELLTVVVVTYNSSHCIIRCLESLERVLPRAAVVVVDNASSDDTVAAVRTAFPAVTVVDRARNVGFGAACNEGARHASSPAILFLNPDAELESVILDKLATLLLSDPVGLVAPSCLIEDGRAESGLRPLDKWIGVVMRELFWGRVIPAPGRRAEGSWISGAAFLVSRCEYETVGGFDERFFLYYEDRDLSCRYRYHGLPVRSSGSFAVRHHRSTSSPPSVKENNIPWGLLGMLEYIQHWHGDRVARSAAVLTAVVLACETWFSQLLGWVPLFPRCLRVLGRRKSVDLQDVRQRLFLLVQSGGNAGGEKKCPNAVRAFRGLPLIRRATYAGAMGEG